MERGLTCSFRMKEDNTLKSNMSFRNTSMHSKRPKKSRVRPMTAVQTSKNKMHRFWGPITSDGMLFSPVSSQQNINLEVNNTGRVFKHRKFKKSLRSENMNSTHIFSNPESRVRSPKSTAKTMPKTSNPHQVQKYKVTCIRKLPYRNV